MKTEIKKLYVYVREYSGSTSIEASTNEFDSTYCNSIARTVSAPLCEIDIEVPTISSAEAQKVLSGALLENLISEREKMRAEFQVKLNALNGRIEELQAIELKSDGKE